jgi:hypothetical protein
MRDLEYFVGTWIAQCEDPGTGRRFTLQYRVDPALDGAWLAGFGESEELGVKVRDFWGRDPITGDVVRIILDNHSTHGVARGKGWEGEILRLEGRARGKEGEIDVRETITRLGPSEFKAVWEAKLDKGWTTYSIEHLKRSRA